MVEQVTIVGPSQAADVYCIQYQGTRCIQCSSGYFLNQETQKCEQLDPYCKTHNLSNGRCTSCYGGFSLNNNGRCVTVQLVQIANCLNANNGACS